MISSGILGTMTNSGILFYSAFFFDVMCGKKKVARHRWSAVNIGDDYRLS